MVKDLLEHKKIPTRTLFKRTWKYVRKEKKAFAISLLLIFVNVFLGVISPRITGYFTDYIVRDDVILDTIIIIAVLVFFVAFVTQSLVMVESMILTKAGQRIVYALRMEVFEHVENMSQNQFNDMAVGSLVTRVCSYTSQLSEFFTGTLVKIVRDLLTVTAVYIWMLILSPELGLIMTGVTVVIFAISLVFWKQVHKIFVRERAQLSDLNSFLNESLSGMKIIQLFKQEEKYNKIFKKKNHEFFKT